MKNKPKIKIIGIPSNIGELKEMIKSYGDGVEFGFRNQPMQILHEIEIDGVKSVVFQ